MSIEVALHHRTEYRYDRPIALGPQTVRLRPAPHARTPILSYSLTLEPRPHFLNWQQDPQGNYLARVVFPEKTDRLVITVDLVADMTVINPFDFFLEPAAETYPFTYDPALESELAPFRRTAPAGPLLQRYLRAIDRSPRQRIDFLVELNRRLQARHPLHRPPGARRADAGRDAGARRGLVPRHRLAAGAAAAPSRPRRALRLGLSDPARRRR